MAARCAIQWDYVDPEAEQSAAPLEIEVKQQKPEAKDPPPPAVHKCCLLAPNDKMEFDDPRIPYPMMLSYKLDGLRILVIDGELYTRHLKPVPNIRLKEHLAEIMQVSSERGIVFDCELFDPSADHHGQHIQYLSSHDLVIPDSVMCCIFDCITLSQWWLEDDGEVEGTPFHQRYLAYRTIKDTHPLLESDKYEALEQAVVNSAEEAKAGYELALEEGFEGVMLRRGNATYKHGRSTAKESILLKFKAWETQDGVITKVLQRRVLKEGIERTSTPTGHMERVHTKDSYELDEMVGAFEVQLEDGTVSEINYGEGFNHEVRKQHWQQRDSLIGKCVEVIYQAHGAKDGIRIGRLKQFRPDKD